MHRESSIQDQASSNQPRTSMNLLFRRTAMNNSRRLLAALLLLIAMGALWNAPAAFAQGGVVAEAVPSDPTPPRGATITVDINIDVSGTNPAKLLGSFTGSLKWDRELIRYVSHSGTKAPFTGVVNVMDAGGTGTISFNGANPNGAAGKSNVLTVTFVANSPNGVAVVLDLEFTAMLAALDFTDLMPLLTVNDGTITTAVHERYENASLPKDFALGQNFPNPFDRSAERSRQSPATEISYELPKPSEVALTIFNLVGQKVKTLVNGKITAGRHTVSWDGTDEAGRSLASGVYIYRLEAGGSVHHRRMTLLQ
jgi:hypothetical protein